jgi:hypothetical protein
MKLQISLLILTVKESWTREKKPLPQSAGACGLIWTAMTNEASAARVCCQATKLPVIQ